MRYATQQHARGVTITHVKTLDPRIVSLRVTLTIPEFPTHIRDTSLTLYERLLLTGTKKRSKRELDEYLKRHGIVLSTSSGLGTLTVVATCRDNRVRETISLIRELLTEPLMSARELTIKRATFLEENREAHDDADRVAEIGFINALYPTRSPLSMRTLVEERAEITATNTTMLRALGRDVFLGPSFITIVGDHAAYRTAERLIPRLEHDIPHPLVPYVHPETAPMDNHFITIPSKTNIELRLGQRLSLTPKDPTYLALSFGIAVLGKVGGFSGRLMSTVREKEGLTYGIYASLAAAHIEHMGHFEVSTFFTARDLEKGIAATKREIRKIVDGGITNEELTTFREILKNQFLIAHGSNARRVSLYHGATSFGKSPEMLMTDQTNLSVLSRSAVNDALRSYIDPDKIVISGAGPVTKGGRGIL
jgi:zinc protease